MNCRNAILMGVMIMSFSGCVYRPSSGLVSVSARVRSIRDSKAIAEYVDQSNSHREYIESMYILTERCIVGGSDAPQSLESIRMIFDGLTRRRPGDMLVCIDGTSITVEETISSMYGSVAGAVITEGQLKRPPRLRDLYQDLMPSNERSGLLIEWKKNNAAINERLQHVGS